MGKKLVVVESPAKAKTINKILGGDYIVESSVGHIRDLPERTLGVDVENHFAPKYVLSKGKQKVVDTLLRAAKGCDEIYLAPDPDREGEAIAWHIREVLAPDNGDKPFYRVQYNEITPRAVREAFAHPGTIDMARVDAQQARRVLDRLVGYTVSPMLWRRIRRGLSAGRVQSVALRLVCEREAAIEKFVPEPYWIIGATVRKIVAPLDPFDVKLSRIGDDKADVRSEEQARTVLSDLEGRDMRVAEIATRTINRNAPPPFITSTLQQGASGACGFSPKRTMALAQALYEGKDMGEGPVGLITYMRTDSVNVSRDAQEACRQWVAQRFGNDYVPEKPNTFRSRGSAQEAHEAIRPTNVALTPDAAKRHLDVAELKLYRLIWERFVASQMSPARIAQRTVKVDAVPPTEEGTRYQFSATASDVLFPGYQKVAKPAKRTGEGEDGEEEQKLPPLSEREPLACLKWLSDRKETKPPPRFNEASLVRELERNGVGRPSTYAQILSTIQQRQYVANEKRTLVPTALGRNVNNLLVETLDNLFDVGFTATMEETLDAVERGETEWTQMLASFYENFQAWMAKTRLPPANDAHVRRTLALFEGVTEWAPPVTRGKRTFSDEKFVTSVAQQVEDKSREVSQRQLQALVKILWRYREQVPGAEAALREMDFGELLDHPDMQPPRETTARKLEIAAGLELNERTRAFVESLDGRVRGGSRLTPAQLAALNSVLENHAKQIENYDAVREELALGAPPEADTESGALLEGMRNVKTWNEPVRRGKRVFNDEEFFTSLSEQFASRGSLSPRQRAALKRMVHRYREQIPAYEALAKQFELGRGGKREEKAPS